MTGETVTVATAYIDLVPSLSGLHGDVDRELRRVDDDADRAGKRIGGRFTDGFKGALVGMGTAIAGAFAVDKIKDVIGDSIAQASDLNEVATKTNQIFGDASSGVTDFASKGAKALGQSNLAIQNAVAGFGVYGKAAGLAGQDNVKFSTGLTQLATDMASFSNTSVEQATEALSAGLRGETEPLRAYGVLLDDASLRQEALAQGLITTTKDALTPQQKVLASQALIMKQTTDAQGDFARTSSGLANQQRILSASWEDAKGKLGEAFLPGITAAVTAVNNNLFPMLDSVQGKVGDFKTKVQDAWDVLRTGDFKGGTSLGEEDSPLVNALFTAREKWLDIAPQLHDAWKVLTGQEVRGGQVPDSPLIQFADNLRSMGLDVFDKLRDIWDKLWGLGEKLWPSIKSIGESLWNAWQRVNDSGWGTLSLVFDGIKAAVDAAIWVVENTLIPALDWLAGFFRDTPDEVLILVGAFTLWKTVTLGISVATWAVQAATKAWAIAQAALNAIMNANPIMLVIIGLTALAAAVVWAYQNVGWFRDLIDGAWNNVIKPVFDALVTAGKAVWDWFANFGENMSNLWTSISTWVSDTLPIFTTVFDYITNTIGNFINIVKGVIDFLVGVFTGDWQRAWDGILAVLKGVWDQILNFLGFFVEIGSQVIGWIWDGIKAGWELVIDWFKELPGTVWDAIVSFTDTVIGWGGEFIGWLWQGIKNVAEDIWAWFSGGPNDPNSLLGGIWSGIISLTNWVLELGGKLIGWVKDGIISGVTAIWNWFSNTDKDDKNGLLGQIWGALSGLGSKFLEFGASVVGWIVDGITSGITAVADAIAGLFDDLTFNPDGTISTPEGYVTANPFAPAGARGRVVPGIDPGRRDNMLMPVRSGESVFVPEFTRAIGGEPTVERWNRLAERGMLSLSEGFARGGVYGYGRSAADHVAGVISGGTGNPWVAGLFDTVLGFWSDVIKPALSTAGSVVAGIFQRLIGTTAYNPTAGVEQWRSTVALALGLVGLSDTLANENLTLFQMSTESGGNPNSINLTDINARRGTPSIGLMQVIQPTFDAYKLPGYSNIWAPLDNIIASLRYVLLSGKFGGSLAAGYRGVAYDVGGWLMPYRGMPVNLTREPEPVLSPRQWDIAEQAIELVSNGQVGNTYHWNVYPLEHQEPADIAREMDRQLAFAAR